MMKRVLTVAALLAAGGLSTAAAPIQRIDGEFRLMWANKEGVSMVTSSVTGPRRARNLTEVIVRAERAQSGTDVYAIDTIANCDAGTLSIGNVIAYQLDSVSTRAPAGPNEAGPVKVVTEYNHRVLTRIPADPNEVSPAEPGTNAYVVYDFACSGKGPANENVRPVGLKAVIAYARQRLGL